MGNRPRDTDEDLGAEFGNWLEEPSLLNADRQMLWERLEGEALEHFPSRRTARRFLGFLKRQWGFLGALETWLASPPSTDAKTIMAKRGQVDPCGFPFESGD